MEAFVKSLAPLTGLPESDLAEKLKNEEGENLPEAEAAQVISDLVLAHAKARAEAKAQQFHGKGLKEGATKVETTVREKLNGLGITAGTVDEGLSELANKLALLEEQAKAGNSKLTPEEIKELKIFKQALGSEVETRTATYQQQVEQLKAEAETIRQRLGQVSHEQAVKAALAPVLKGANANFGTNAEQAWQAFFAINPATTIKVENGRAVFLSSEGTPLEDDYGRPLSAKEVLIDGGRWFLGVTEKPKPNTPGGQQGGQGGGAAPILFKSGDDFNRQAKAAQNDTAAYTALLKARMEQERKHGPLK